jgi:hypothetical protein
MKKTILGAITLLALATSVVAESEVKWQRVQLADDGYFMATRNKSAISELIPVDPEKEYVVSGEFKHDKPIGLLYFCIMPYDKDQLRIQRHHVANIPGTEMTLAKEYKAGDTSIIIKDGTKWKTIFDKERRKPYIAFNADHEGTFKDLPNVNTIHMAGIKNENGEWKVDLKTPALSDYPAGTKLRLHKGSGGMMYESLLQEKDFPAGTVKEITANISGERLSGVGGSKCESFWKGTRFIKFFIMELKGNPLLFKNISIKEAE